MNYCAAVWGYKTYTKIESVQNRAIRFYLGVHSYASNHAINGDIGWESCNVRHQVEMLRFWNRMCNMGNNRLTKQVFLWDKIINKKNWCYEVKTLLDRIGNENYFVNLDVIDLSHARERLFKLCKETWESQICHVAKLRTYNIYKQVYEIEPYVYKIQHRGKRSLLAQFRTGVLPLAIETGRYNSTPLEYRLCLLCNKNFLEDEKHFLLHCELYTELRSNLIMSVLQIESLYYFKTENEKLKLLMSGELIKHTANFIYYAYNKRRSFLYK